MEIDKIKLTQIEKAEYNPRTITEESQRKLENSLKEFGLVDPIIINLKNNRIIGGHQRYDIIMQDAENQNREYPLVKYGDYGLILDYEPPTIENEDKEKILNVALNNPNLTGDWDFNKLENILNDLKLKDLEVELTGFDGFELEALLPYEEDDDFDDLFAFDEDEDDLDDIYEGEGEKDISYVIYISCASKEEANDLLEKFGSPYKMKKETVKLLYEEIQL